MSSNKNCPACGRSINHLGSLPVRDFDGSLFNYEGQFLQCQSCGFVRVESGLNDSVIARHYAEESLYSTLSGVGVGGQSVEDEARYAFSVAFMKANSCVAGAFADIGCSRGGFIRYLHKHLPNITPTGVDCDLRSLSALAADGYDAIEGDVFLLPLADEQKDILCYFHVFEHLYDVDAALLEARRVLKPQGTLLIEVPDASLYFHAETYVGPMFWLGMKEHVNHFTAAALLHYLKRNGFDLVELTHSAQPMRGEKKYPSLMLLAIKSLDDVLFEIDQGDYTSFPNDLKCEVASMHRLATDIANVRSEEPICFWGIGLEFFALYGFLAPMLAGRTMRFVDRNPGKIGLTVDGIPIEFPENVPIEGLLVCCSYMSGSRIREEALAIGWPENSIRCL